MITAEEFLREKYNADLHSFQDVVEHLNEFAKQAIKVDRINLLEHVETAFDSANNVVVDRDSITNAPNITLT